MATVSSIIDGLAEDIDFRKAGEWDLVGLQIGDPNQPVESVAVCHEVTTVLVDRVVDEGVDLLVSYHPLLFRPSRQIVAGPGAGGRTWRLARAGVSLVVAHTAFDVADGGTADALFDAIGLADRHVFAPLWGAATVKIVTFAPLDAAADVSDAMASAGAGVVGRYTHCTFQVVGEGTYLPGRGTRPTTGAIGKLSRVPEVRIEMVAAKGNVDGVVAALVSAHPYEEPSFDVIDRRGDAGFLGRIGTFSGSFSELRDQVESELGGSLRISGTAGHTPLTVAVVPGSGASAISAAATAGANVLVAGDIKHHHARRAGELGLAIIDPGHAATERPGVARLYAAVAAGFEGVLDLTGVDSDPWA